MTEEEIQAQKIEDVRKLLRPAPVELHKYPRWMQKRKMQEIVEKNSFSWCDHYGCAVIDDRECFVTEPYRLSLEDHIELAAFAKEFGLNYYISPNSWWFPGYTLRVVFHQGVAHNL